MSRYRTACSLVVSVALLSGLDAWAVDPVRIGVSGPFTGGSAPMGVSMRDGVRLAASEINRAGGVLGHPIELVERDDEARNERGVQITQELINREHVVADVGFINTGVALASERFYQQAMIPVINNVATGAVITHQFLPPRYPDNYVFRTSASDAIQARMIVDEAVDQRKFTRVAIFADSTNYGQLGRQDLEKALAVKGLKPVSEEKFNIGDTDMTAQLLHAKQAGAQVVLTYGIGPELAQVANGMAKLGWTVPLVGSWTLSMANFIDNAGANGEGARMPQTFIQVPNTPKRKAFIAAYQQMFHPAMGRISSPVSAAQGYDSLYLLVAAIRQAGTTDGPKVRVALENLTRPVEGVVAAYTKPYSHDQHEAITSALAVMGEVKGGHVVYAYDKDSKVPTGH